MGDLWRKTITNTSSGRRREQDLMSQTSSATDGTSRTTMSADEALARLLEGNRRFVAGDPMQPDLGRHRRHELAAGQAPFAAILGCADSRTPPEELFGVGLGEIFTVRVAGNSLSPCILGSLEFAVTLLGVPLILVLGHERCGAINAAISVAERGTELPGALMPMVEPLLPAVMATRTWPGGRVFIAARQHAPPTAERLRRDDPAMRERVDQGSLKILAAIYSLDEGTVELLDS
jgi:carbonic anhydrase